VDVGRARGRLSYTRGPAVEEENVRGRWEGRVRVLWMLGWCG
jgi:hypothetical protein